jgi:hypothetical protein
MSLPMKLSPQKFVLNFLVLIILIAAFLLPRVFSLGQFVAVDEVNWLHRSANFYDAVVRQDWGDTYVNNSPGVVTTWVGALAYKIAAPNYKVTRELDKTSYITFENNLLRKASVQPLYVLATSRMIMILLLMAVWLICFYYAQRLFGILPSLVGFLLMALDPFFIALSRMSHLDAPQAMFMFLSILAFLNFLYRGNRWLDLVVSGMAGSLALLSKLPGIFIIPAIGLIGTWDYLRARFVQKAASSDFIDRSLRKLVRYFLVWGLVFIVTYAVVWPSMWVKPLDTLERVFITSTKYTKTIVGEYPYEQEAESYTPEARTLADFVRYPSSFLWRTTPIVLLGLLLLLIAYLRKVDQITGEQVVQSLQGLLIFVLIYTVGVTLPAKSSEKYYAPVFLVVDLLAGLGWSYVVFDLVKRSGVLRTKLLSYAILTGAIIIQSVWVYRSFPYYYTDYNPLLGGLSRAAQVMQIGVGEGLDQAGLYLMQKPGSSQLKVMSWYGTGPLSYFFNGDVVPLYMSNSEWTPEFVQRLREMDYLVVYPNQKFRNQPPELFDLLTNITPEYTVTLEGTEYTWIYKVSDIPLSEQEED